MEDAAREAIKAGKPVLGVCLGMQLLYESSLENGEHPGMGILPGRVVPFTGPLKVPHMGWNALLSMETAPCSGGFPRELRIFRPFLLCAL